MSVAGGQPKKPANPSCKATKHIERTFLISDYYEGREVGRKRQVLLLKDL